MRKVLIALSLMSFEVYSIATAKAIDGIGCINLVNACFKTCSDRSEGGACYDNCALGYKFCDNVSGTGLLPPGAATPGKNVLNGGAGNTQTIPGTTTAGSAGTAPATTTGTSKLAPPPVRAQTSAVQGPGTPQSIQQRRNLREK